MITLALLKHLEEAGIGRIDSNLFWEKLGLGKDGIYISSIGNPTARGTQKRQTYQLYSRGKSDIEGRRQLENALKILNESYELCELPGIKGITEGYSNVTIMPTSTISNGGLDANGRIIWTATGEIYY